MLRRSGPSTAFHSLVLSLITRSTSSLTVLPPPPALQLKAEQQPRHLQPQHRARSSLAAIVNSASAAAAENEGDEPPAPAGEDELVTALSADGSISAKAIVTTNLVAETSRLQGLGGLAAAALGRAVTCSILVADGLKDEETFQVNFRGDGPLRGVLALSNGRLEARGYVGNPAVTLPPNALGKFDVGAGVGKGTLQVVRTKNLPGEEVSTPYTSMTEIK